MCFLRTIRRQDRLSINNLLRRKKNVEDSVKDGLIIINATTRMFFALKVPNINASEASLDSMDIMKLAGGICGGVLVKDYAVYKKWIKE